LTDKSYIQNAFIQFLYLSPSCKAVMTNDLCPPMSCYMANISCSRYHYAVKVKLKFFLCLTKYHAMKTSIA